MLVPLVARSSLYNMITERYGVPSVMYILPIFSTTAKDMLLRRSILKACYIHTGLYIDEKYLGQRPDELLYRIGRLLV
jgi:hypothetical protein